jgi:hypothetical protein
VERQLKFPNERQCRIRLGHFLCSRALTSPVPGPWLIATITNRNRRLLIMSGFRSPGKFSSLELLIPGFHQQMGWFETIRPLKIVVTSARSVFDCGISVFTSTISLADPTSSLRSIFGEVSAETCMPQLEIFRSWVVTETSYTFGIRWGTEYPPLAPLIT